ncbi:hypothetical protein [Bifidobacterium cebidarum]|uniref:Uncharacterized protein n=1 Tax=Bifidobacterium cebidarum TaxID=2650773 RepID=A0A6I1GAD6_9BIFI|nr:hypothetical protein [Bifidobacterium cebidarum]KAB7788634.1 hypothetical protein F7D08_0913 [Bifidobacterium cebidarum]
MTDIDDTSERTHLVERFPQLADLDSQDNDGKLRAFRDALSALQRELDANRQ